MTKEKTPSPRKGLLPIIAPFSGFYQTIHEMPFDDEITRVIEDNPLTEDDIKTDWNKYKIDYSKEYLNRLQDEIFYQTDMQVYFDFVAVHSPKYYNFSSDSIEARISQSDVYRIYRSLDKSILKAFIKEQCSDTSGFVSFYSPYLKDWEKKPFLQWDANQLGIVLDCFCRDFIESVYVDNANEIASEYIEIACCE